MTSKKNLTERDICTKYIQPALEKAGWNQITEIREEVSFTDGRIYVKGNLSSRGKRKRADYILYFKPNLRNFRQFYLTYPDKKICDTVCSKLSWSHNRLIMRIDNLKSRNYYLTEAAQQQWSVRHLQRNINTLYYERLLSSQHPQSTPENQADTEKINQRAFIKDPYVLEFLQLSDDLSKYRLVLPTEEELIAEIERERLFLEDGEVE